jgi:superfamily II DNA helicase RecQ
VRRVFAHCFDESTGFVWSVLIFYSDVAADRKPRAIVERESAQQVTVLTPEEEMLYEELHRWRNERASQEGLAAYMIAHNEWLRQMVRLRVRTPDDLLKIKGFGQKRIQEYGKDLLRILSSLEAQGR